MLKIETLKNNHKEIKEVKKASLEENYSDLLMNNLLYLRDNSDDEFIVDYADRLVRQLEKDSDYCGILYCNYKKLYLLSLEK